MYACLKYFARVLSIIIKKYSIAAYDSYSYTFSTNLLLTLGGSMCSFYTETRG